MRAETGLTNIVYDADGELDRVGMGLTHQHYVLEEGSRVFHYRVGDNSTFAGNVDTLLGR